MSQHFRFSTKLVKRTRKSRRRLGEYDFDTLGQEAKCLSKRPGSHNCGRRRRSKIATLVVAATASESLITNAFKV